MKKYSEMTIAEFVKELNVRRTGEDYNAAIAEMEAAWKKYCMDHAWD